LTFVTDIKKLHVELTTMCQAECPMCPRTISGYHDGRMKNTEIKFKQFTELVAPLLPLEQILFCGTLGDPLANKDLRIILLWLKQKSIPPNICINTNGALGNTKLWRDIAFLIKHNPYHHVVFSLDGLEDTNHIYRKNVVWGKAMDNAKSYIAAGGVAHWEMLVFKHNEHQIDEAKQLAEDMGFRLFKTKATSRFGHTNSGLEPSTNTAWNSEEKEFKCKVEGNKSVYLSAEGIWYPCCWTHGSTLEGYDTQWGDPIVNINDRSTKWYNLEKNILSKSLDKVCYNNCATNKYTGQWTTETYFS
jgi:MoaA/NifB/PqqE/SkfB family radical SAM enzyme